MGSGFTIEIPYDQMVLLVMGLFMFIGATRGWRSEFVTSCVLMVLLAFLFKPELAAPVVEYASRIIRLVLAFIQGHGNIDLNQLISRYNSIQLPFDASNPYMFLIIALIVFVVLSYGTRGSTRGLTALSRILGGLLGLFNGFMIISLLKEYVVGYFQRNAPEVAAASNPSQVSVAVRGLPSGGLLAGSGRQVALILLVSITAVLLIWLVTGKKKAQ